MYYIAYIFMRAGYKTFDIKHLRQLFIYETFETFETNYKQT